MRQTLINRSSLRVGREKQRRRALDIETIRRPYRNLVTRREVLEGNTEWPSQQAVELVWIRRLPIGAANSRANEYIGRPLNGKNPSTRLTT